MLALGGGSPHCGQVDLLRRAGLRQRIEAGRHHVEDAGGLQVVPQRDAERRRQPLAVSVVGGFEVGDRETNLLDAQAGAGADPVLRGKLERRTR